MIWSIDSPTASDTGLSISEQILDPELHLPRNRVPRARNAAEARAPEIIVGQIEIRGVGHVVALGPQLQLASVAQAQILEDRHIEPPLIRPVHQGVPDVTGREMRGW